MGNPRKVVIACALIAACVVTTWAANDPTYSHVYDSTYRIVAYELTPEQEVEFVVDGHKSPFWSVWDSTGLDEETINGVDHYAWGAPATSREEGQLSVRVAYGDDGIYMLLSSQDDDRSQMYCFGGDCYEYAELFCMPQSPQELYSNPSLFLPCMNAGHLAHQMSPAYCQFQIRLGLQGLEPVESFGLNRWNPAAADIATAGCALSNIRYDRDVTFDEAVAMGIRIEIPAPAESTLRRQEWLVPWSQWGTGVPRRTRGQAVGFCFGFNDLDPLVQATYTAFRWRKCDPYSNTSWNIPPSFTGTPSDTTTSFDAWGDIYFGEPLDSAVVHAGVKRGAVTRAQAHSPGIAGYFTITGRRVDGLQNLQPSAGILLQQDQTAQACAFIPPSRGIAP